NPHNYLPQNNTTVRGRDHHSGSGRRRDTPHQRGPPFYLGQPVYNLLLQMFFEYGVAIQHLELGKVAKKKWPADSPERKQFEADRRLVLKKVGKQVAKDYLIFPLLTGPAFFSTLTANITANVVRNVWTNAVIFCGHFPDGAEKFTKADIDGETQGQWYLRQMLGSANISGGPLLHFMTGNLSHQIEHHLFPDLPSNRLAAIAVRVRELCDKYDLPYTTGSLPVQYAKSWRTIIKLSLPNKYLRRSADDAPETRSERVFGGAATIDPATGRRRGLRTALQEGRRRIARRAAAAVA
uniref:fatty acid desaturase family protein n=1 Tax=Nocardia wallacei TaxID=480035 RepID=UPI00245642FF